MPRTIRTSRPGCCRCGSSAPKGCCSTPSQSNNYARGLIAQRGASAVQALLKKWAADPEHLDVDAAATILWELLTKEAKVLTKVTLRSQKEKPLAGDVWQVNSEKLVVERSQVPPALHDLPADYHPTGPECRLHPPQLPRHHGQPSSPTRRTTTCG